MVLGSHKASLEGLSDRADCLAGTTHCIILVSDVCVFSFFSFCFTSSELCVIPLDASVHLQGSQGQFPPSGNEKTNNLAVIERLFQE